MIHSPCKRNGRPKQQEIDKELLEIVKKEKQNKITDKQTFDTLFKHGISSIQPLRVCVSYWFIHSSYVLLVFVHFVLFLFCFLFILSIFLSLSLTF